MRFWDSSAVLPFLTTEPSSLRVRDLVERDEEMAVWWATEVECWSAISRARRSGRITVDTESHARKILVSLRGAWTEISPSFEVRRQALRLLNVHELRAADALQLGAALVWAGRYDNAEFVSFDARLRDTARLEGLSVIGGYPTRNEVHDRR